MPTDGEHHLTRYNAGAAGQMRREKITVPVDLGDCAVDHSVEIGGLHCIAHTDTQAFIEFAQNVTTAIDR